MCVAGRFLLWCLSIPAVVCLAGEPDLTGLGNEYAGLPEAPAAIPVEVQGQKTQKVSVSNGKRAWDSYEKQIGIPLRKWAVEEIDPAKGGTVFYPFSGPDFVTVAQIFPEADRYILVAIQPAGPVVNLRAMTEGAVLSFRTKFSAEWEKFGMLGFFRTVDLNENTSSAEVRLTATPVMMSFAVALGYRIDGVRPLELDAASAEYKPVEMREGVKWNSVRFDLSKDERKVILDYVCVDLSDGFLKSHAPELAWIQKSAKNPILLKAASHLLPKPYFSACRTAIVEGAPLLIQDETGLEYPDLVKMGTVRLYGRFAGVMKLFSQDSQRELAEAYASAGQTIPLPFAYSYQKSADRRSLQVVRRERKP